MTYASARSVTAQVAEIVRPPRRMLPSEAAGHFKLRDKEGRPWSRDVAPYMVEPLDLLAGRAYRDIAFIGPARTSKTFSLIHGALNYIVTCDPGDTSVIQMTHDTARKFSKEEVDPVIRNSPGLAERLSPRSDDNNTFDKRFRSGMTFTLGWPAISQLSGMTRKYMLVTDYDRPTNRDNVDGEGPLFDQAAKRVQTYLSRGKCLIESSPGEDFTDPKWAPASPHEAPPVLGIGSIYNRGTMARWYWPCSSCGEFFQAVPGPKVFGLPEWKVLIDQVQTCDLPGLAQEYARLACPKCGQIHLMEHRREMNLAGRWLHDGESITPGGRIAGTRRSVRIASYWLGGVAAAFQRWDDMLLQYFTTMREYTRTGDENAIKVKVNVDFGDFYMPRSAAARRKAEDLINRAEDWVRGTVPAGVQFLTAAVDVQGNYFVVCVYGWGVDQEGWLIDRFRVVQSNRLDGDRPAMVEPGVYLDDWKLLYDQVVERTYPLAEDESLRMPIYVMGYDSGGREGVTARAYEFYRWMAGRGEGFKVQPVKGASADSAPRFEIRYPDARGRTDGIAKGDVPVLFINPTIWKDAVVGDLANLKPGPGYFHLPSWLEKQYFGEYVAESRTSKGWDKNAKRNEQFDLHVYARAHLAQLGVERINWSNRPPWACRPVRVAAGQPVAAAPETSPFKALGRRLR